jgi:hypothetical protein
MSTPTPTSTFMLGALNHEVATRLEGAFQDFAEKLNSTSGPEWEEMFKRFLRKERNWELCPVCNPFRETEEVAIQIPALPRPTLAELKANWSWIRSIERDTSPTEPVSLVLGTVLCEGETDSINGTEYERRLAPKQDVLLGFQHRQWLLEHQAEFPEFMALLGKVYIDFSGLVVVHGNGDRHVPYVSQDDRRWGGGWSWLVYGFAPDGRVAASRK